MGELRQGDAVILGVVAHKSLSPDRRSITAERVEARDTSDVSTVAMRLAHLILIAMLCIAIPSYGLAAVAARGACLSGGEMETPAAPAQADACCADMNADNETSSSMCAGGVCGSASSCYTVYLFKPSTDVGLYVRPAPRQDPSPALRIGTSDPSGFWRPPRSF